MHSVSKKGGVSKWHELHLIPILEVGLFDVQRIDLICTLVCSFGFYYILEAVVYVYKSEEIVAL